MKDVRLEGDVLEPGSVISFRIDPPVPYEMRISVEVTDSEPERRIDGLVSGDLRGRATLTIADAPQGARVTTSWDVELASRRIRRVIVVARPVLIWAQHWAVQVSLRGFRRHLREHGPPP